ncbi:hypothetical protein L6164_028835 [Bauhinia variegata]|uniref:Uncharacterized protein n=1 Tax=Bauhinia variegata TaxID=167791 RepID=A0ACB9L6V9_BAUVA|nr:hypothetical protein L6164_028835 [Bauhinia variegata]
MAATSVAFNGIVVEVLTNDNYENWSVLVKNYLMGQGLWDVVSSFSVKSDDEWWKRKNARALHIIQLSCGSNALSQIKKCVTAKDAWNRLSHSFSSYMEGNRDIELGIFDDVVRQDDNIKQLREHVKADNWDGAKSFIDKDPRVVFSVCSSGRTILHTAVIAGHEEIVEKLIDLLTEKEKLLKMKENYGDTALALAAKLTDNPRMAKCMVKECKDLLTMKSRDDAIPVLLASDKGHKKMTRYLYNETPWDDLSEDEADDYGALLLTRCIRAEIFGNDSLASCILFI